MQHVETLPSSGRASPSLVIKLIYLDHAPKVRSAECARVALFMAGIHFEDARMGYEGMYNSRNAHLWNLPVARRGGQGRHQETQAIARYVGRPDRVVPFNPFLAAKADSAIDALTDISDLVTATMQERDPQARFSGARR